MVIVFAGFAAGQMLVIKQTGLALAVAVLIDATAGADGDRAGHDDDAGPVELVGAAAG